MEIETIEDLFKSDNNSINKKDLSTFFNKRLQELYIKDKKEPLFDYDEIRYSAIIDFIYEMMPSLKQEIDIN